MRDLYQDRAGQPVDTAILKSLAVLPGRQSAGSRWTAQAAADGRRDIRAGRCRSDIDGVGDRLQPRRVAGPALGVARRRLHGRARGARGGGTGRAAQDSFALPSLAITLEAVSKPQRRKLAPGRALRCNAGHGHA